MLSRKPIYRATQVIAAAWFLGSLCGCGASSGKPSASGVEVLEVDGISKLQKGESAPWQELEEGAKLEPGDRVRVDRGTVRLKLGPGKVHTLREGSSLKVESYEPRSDDSPTPEPQSNTSPSATAAG